MGSPLVFHLPEPGMHLVTTTCVSIALITRLLTFKRYVPKTEAYNVFLESNVSKCIGILRGMRLTPDTQGWNLAIWRLDLTIVPLFDIWGKEERQWVYFCL